jgi:serine/threonine protein kinase
MPVNPVAHPSADTLQAFGLGKLDDATAEGVLRHLESCRDCHAKVASLSDDSFLDRLRDAHNRSGTPAPAGSLPGVARSLQGHAPGRRPDPAAPNLPPELADNPQYKDVRELGRGGMGVVYLAKNVLMDRLEVLKVVNKALLDKPEAAERFLREIRSAAKLSHDNVVKAYSAQSLGELLVFAMEYVQGEDLAKAVDQQGPLPVPNACFYVYQAALGLQHAHEHGLVHRDIKPHNLILARQEKKHVVKVLDFGLAKATREGEADAGLTGTGKMMGTPDYLAPEQMQDAASADVRADVYSLGCALYFLLAGSPPFRANNLYQLLYAHQSTEATPLNTVRKDVPAELAAVVAKMMAKAPPQRYQTPIEVAQALVPFFKAGAPGASTTVSQVKVKKGDGKDSALPPPRLDTPQVLGCGALKKAPARRARPATGKGSKKWSIAAGLGVAVLLLVFAGLWAGGVLRVKTQDGTIVLDNLPPEADVTVDDEKVTLKTMDGNTYAVSIAAGKKQRLKVKKDGVTLFGEEVQIDAGGQRTITLRYEPGAPGKDSLEQWFVPGTRWEGKQIRTEPTPTEGNVWFIVSSREGNKFRGRCVTELRLDWSVEGVLSNDHSSFTWKAIEQAVNEWQPNRAPFEFVEGSEKWKDGRVRLDWKRPLPGGKPFGGFLEFTARKVIPGPGDGDRWPPALYPGKGYCGPAGKWRVQNGELVQDDVVKDLASQPWINFGALSWDEYDMRMKAVKTAGENGFAIAFDIVWGSGKLTQWCIGLNGNRDAYVETSEKLPDRVQSTRRTEILPVTIKENQWYDILVRVRGKQIECFLDGRRQFQFTHADRHGGMVGLHCWRMAARFKDIEIKAPDGTTLWKGPPELP